MAAPRIPLRCTQCGASVDLPPPAGPATSWSSCPQCGHPMPVVPWRERAPLFSWEVFPHLYPPLPPPRIPSKGVRPALLALLIAGAVALGGLSAVTAAEGAFALGPGTVTVSGSVVAASAPSSPPGPATPLSGAHVTVQYTGGPPRTALTGGAGTFEFSGVPPGGITLNASAKGYSGESLVLFLSSVYSTEGSPGDPAILTLTPSNGSGNASAPVALVETPYTDLESFVASLWSSSALLALATVVAAFGCLALARDARPAVALAGGAAAAIAPGVVFVFEIYVAFPWIGAAAGVAVGLGAVVASIQAIRLAALDRPLEPE